MSKVIDNITSKAEKLYQLRHTIASKEDEMKAELLAMKAERDAVQASLLSDLNKHKLASIKVASGDSFSRGIRKGVSIISELGALKWAMENSAVTVDRRLVAQRLKDVDPKSFPKCFEFTETEFISVRKAK